MDFENESMNWNEIGEIQKIELIKHNLILGHIIFKPGLWVVCKNNGDVRYVDKLTGKKTFEDKGYLSGISPSDCCHIKNYEIIDGTTLNKTYNKDTYNKSPMQLRLTNEVLSPLSGKIMPLQSRTASCKYKGVEVFYEFLYYQDGGYQFTTTESDEISIANIKQSYKDKMESGKNKMWWEMNSDEKWEFLNTINHLDNEEYFKELEKIKYKKPPKPEMKKFSHDETEELWDSITGEINKEPEPTYDSFKGIMYRDLVDSISEYKIGIDDCGMKGTNFVQREGDLDNQPEMMIRTTDNPEWRPLKGTLDVKDNPSISTQNTIVPPEIGDEFIQPEISNETNYDEALQWWGLLNISEKMNIKRQFGIVDQLELSINDIKMIYEMKTQEVMEKSSQEEADVMRADEEKAITLEKERCIIVIDISKCDDVNFVSKLIDKISDGTIIVKIKDKL